MKPDTHITVSEIQQLCNITNLPVCAISAEETLPLLHFNHLFEKNLSYHPDYLTFPEVCKNADTINAIRVALDQKLPHVPAIALRPGNTEIAKQRWADLALSHVETENGPAALLWFIDVTERKTQLRKMRELMHQAETMNKMKSDFLATMSHEIRTPMQSIYGLLELIAEKELDDDIRSMVATAKHSSTGLLEILDDVLDLAKVNAGKMELDYFETPIRTLAYGVVECMEVKLQGKELQLVSNVEDDIPPVVMGDPKRLRQILLNLVGNALKFTDRGSIVVRVTRDIKVIHPKRTDEGHFGLRFEVTDTGMGMPKSVADKLFTPFTQADSSTTRKFGGTGLGLSICSKLVELMGGQIGVISTEGQGSTFWFEIPTKAASQDDTSDLPNLEGLAVLSVEDHPAAAKEIFLSLKSMGADIIMAASCQEGLELITQRPFDVAIMDQGLPDGLGVDLAKEARKIRPHMGVIIYTVRDDIGLQHSAISLGATYLDKPASRLGLGEAVKGAARHKSLNVLKRPARLLIAEDTASVRDILQRQLEKLGVPVDFVETGVHALNEFDKDKHGMLLTDIHMPDMDGYELTTRMRGNQDMQDTDKFGRLPIVALTADVQLARPQAYLSRGFDECLLKPVTLGQFKQLLLRWGMLEETLPEDEDNTENTQAETTETRYPIDKNDVIEQLGAFDESFVDMLEAFISMTEPLVERVIKAYRGKDLALLSDEAHSLRGAALSACCKDLGAIAEKIEKLADKEEEVSEQHIVTLQTEFKRVCDYKRQLEKEFQNASP